MLAAVHNPRRFIPGSSPVHTREGLSSYLLEVKTSDLVSLWVLKGSSTPTFTFVYVKLHLFGIPEMFVLE